MQSGEKLCLAGCCLQLCRCACLEILFLRPWVDLLQKHLSPGPASTLARATGSVAVWGQCLAHGLWGLCCVCASSAAAGESNGWEGECRQRASEAVPRRSATRQQLVTAASPTWDTSLLRAMSAARTRFSCACASHPSQEGCSGLPWGTGTAISAEMSPRHRTKVPRSCKARRWAIPVTLPVPGPVTRPHRGCNGLSSPQWMGAQPGSSCPGIHCALMSSALQPAQGN